MQVNVTACKLMELNASYKDSKRLWKIYLLRYCNVPSLCIPIAILRNAHRRKVPCITMCPCGFEHSGTFLNILEHSGTFWNILEHSGTFWNILEHSETFWNILEHFGTFWNVLEHSGNFWKLLEAWNLQNFKLSGNGQTDRRTLELLELLLRS